MVTNHVASERTNDPLLLCVTSWQDDDDYSEYMLCCLLAWAQLALVSFAYWNALQYCVRSLYCSNPQLREVMTINDSKQTFRQCPQRLKWEIRGEGTALYISFGPKQAVVGLRAFLWLEVWERWISVELSGTKTSYVHFLHVHVPIFLHTGIEYIYMKNLPL